MKANIVRALIAAVAAFFFVIGPASAGILTLDDMSPSFTPPGDFSKNTIVADTTVEGGLIHLVGSTSVAPDVANTALVAVSGTYSAIAGEKFSIAYKFAVDLNSATSVNYTMSASVSGVPIPDINGTFTPGLHVYEGTTAMPSPFPTDSTGDFSGTLTIDFGSSGGQPEATSPVSLDLNVQQIDFQLSTLTATVDPPSQALNISTRADVGTDDNVLIDGFIITGTDPKLVVLRALGPSLILQNVSGVLADPFLELHDSTGATIATNDNWMDLSPDDQMVLTDYNLAPVDNAESAIVMTLDPGNYTAIVRGVNNTTGIALVEAYDLDGGATDSQFANISTRGAVGAGENVMIGGFIVGGGGGGFSQFIVRGLGPSLASLGVAGVLPDPMIEVHNGNGDLLDSNDNWMDDPNMQTIIDNGLAPTDPSESALYEVLAPGNYTVILSGGNGATAATGVGLVEAYDVD
jgi:hypothetical protein